jgi:hypothetical protein
MKLIYLMLALPLLASCGGGGGDMTEALVRYEGTDLVVRSARYERKPANNLDGGATCEAAGTVCYVTTEVLATATGDAAFSKMLSDLDLRVVSGDSTGLTLLVPAQYERQWVSALLHEVAVSKAGVKPVVR